MRVLFWRPVVFMIGGWSLICSDIDKDLADCKEVRQTEWRGRSLWQQMKEALASLAEDQM